MNIWKLDVASKQVTVLTSETTTEDYPRVSPGGGRLLFYSDRTGREELWTLDRRTNDMTQLSRGGGAQNAWSPEGGWVAYGTPHGLQVLQLTSGRVTTVGADLSTACPAFSPDGNEVAFQGRYQDSYRLYRASVDGSDLRVIPTPAGEPGNPSWARDGRTIYYQLDQRGYRNIWAVDLFSGESRQISTGNTDDAHPDVTAVCSATGHSEWITRLPEAARPAMELLYLELDALTQPGRALAETPYPGSHAGPPPAPGAFGTRFGDRIASSPPAPTTVEVTHDPVP